jgi:hypothetical protein
MTSTQERQAKSSVGLRERLFDTLDAVMEGKIGKEEVECICFISQEIIKSAKVDLEFEAMAHEKIRMQHMIEKERGASISLLGSIMDSTFKVEEDEV